MYPSQGDLQTIPTKKDGNANNFSGVIKEPMIHHRGIS